MGGTPLEVFSGKEATLNRVIMLVLRSSKKPLAKYDVYLQVHGVKGLRHVDSKSVYRRMDALDCEGWIAQNGTRPAKVRGESVLYELALKGKAALRLDDVSIECFLERATGEQLVQFIGLFSDDLKV